MPEPFLIEIALAPAAAADQATLLAALDRLASNDPAFGFSHDPQSGQIIARGTGEESLDGAITSLRSQSGIAFAVGAPQLAYRETLTRRVEIDHTHRTRSSGQAAFARVKLVVEPSREGPTFESRIAGGAVPDAFVPGVAAGIASVSESGILAGFPVVDVKVTLIDGATHDTESSALAFEIAARAAFRQALKDGGPLLLEPIMTVEVTTLVDYVGFVTGDLRARRGRSQREDARGTEVEVVEAGREAIVRALVPLSNMFGYVNQLRSGTQGHGTFTMRFSHYAPVGPRPDDNGPAAPAIALRRA